MSLSPEELKSQLKGVVPVQYCPHKENGEVDYEGLRENTEFLVDFTNNGEKDFVIMTNGSTTEFYANSVEEQKKVIDTVVEASGNVPVIAGTAAPGTKLTIELSQYAQEAGADAAVVVLPYYHNATVEGLYRHYTQIADAVDISVMIYNNPDVSGAAVPVPLAERLSKVENIVGVKDNYPTAGHYSAMSANIDPDDFVLINGLGDVPFVGSAAYGFKYKGFVTALANFAPSLSYEVYEAVKEKDFDKADKALDKQRPFWNFVGKVNGVRESASIIPSTLRTNYMYMGVGKAAMDLVGLNGGPLREPLDNLTAEEKDELRDVLKEIGAL